MLAPEDVFEGADGSPGSSFLFTLQIMVRMILWSSYFCHDMCMPLYLKSKMGQSIIN